MVHKYVVYEKNQDIDEIWNETIEFWMNNKGSIEEKFISTNKHYRKLVIQHSPSIKGYGFSMGESYSYLFGYIKNEGITIIAIDSKFSIIGKGLVWRFPQEYLNKWAKYIGIDTLKLSNKKDLVFQEKIDIINGCAREKVKEEYEYCPYCGSDIEKKQKKCPSCNSLLS